MDLQASLPCTQGTDTLLPANLAEALLVLSHLLMQDYASTVLEAA